MKTKFILLGCGNSMGTPRIDGFWGNCNKNNKKNIRTKCSAFISKGSNSILIDTSPDIRMQLLNNQIGHINSVIYTHEHSDQINGLFELRPFTFSSNKKFNFFKNTKKINIYGSLKTIKNITKRFDFCFKKIGVYPPIAKANIINKKFSLGQGREKVSFKCLQVKHGEVKSTVYIFNKTAYLSDCNDITIINRKELKNLNCLIIDCLKIDKNFAHFNLDESIFIHKNLKPKKTILTNLHYDLDYNFLLQHLPRGIIPGYDGLKIIL